MRRTTDDSLLASERKAEQRRRRRAEGMKPLEVWLPEQLIRKIDELKTEEIQSRDAVIMALIAGTLNEARSKRSGEQLALL